MHGDDAYPQGLHDHAEGRHSLVRVDVPPCLSRSIETSDAMGALGKVRWCSGCGYAGPTSDAIGRGQVAFSKFTELFMARFQGRTRMPNVRNQGNGGQGKRVWAA